MRYLVRDDVNNQRPRRRRFDSLDRAREGLGKLDRFSVEVGRLDSVGDAEGGVVIARLEQCVLSSVGHEVRALDAKREAERGHGLPPLPGREMIGDSFARAGAIT